MKLIVNLRNTVGVNSEINYVFAVPTKNSIHYLRENDTIRKHIRQIEFITSTKLRVHIATSSQLLNLEKKDARWLSWA